MLENIEKYALENSVPIMLKDGIEFLCNYIKDNNYLTILEIGTAIGYSAIKMALVNENVKIVSLERDEKRYNEAIKNISKMGLNKQIEVVLTDAMDYVDSGKYDLIFIDAAKGKYINFFEKFKVNLNENGSIVSDNLAFHNLVTHKELIETKNQRKIVEKIEKYISYLNTLTEYQTVYYEIGDGIGITRKGKFYEDIA